MFQLQLLIHDAARYPAVFASIARHKLLACLRRILAHTYPFSNNITSCHTSLSLSLSVCAVGMSTAFEVIEAAHSGMQVLGLSFITNVCAGPTDVGIPAASHGEVLDSAKEGKTEFQALVTRIVRKMETKDFPVPRPAAHFEGVKAKAPVAAVAPTPAAAEPLVATLAKSEAAPVPAATAAAAAPRPAVDVKAVVVLAAVTGAVAGVAATILARCFVHYRRSL